jgi:hypothetical protein
MFNIAHGKLFNDWETQGKYMTFRLMYHVLSYEISQSLITRTLIKLVSTIHIIAQFIHINAYDISSLM